MGGGTSHIGGETSHIGGETSFVGAKRLTGGRNVLKLGQIITATGAKRLEDGCERSLGGGTSMVRNVLEPNETNTSI